MLQYGRLQFYEIDALEYDATRYLLAMVLPVCAWILEVDLQLVLLFKPRSKPSRWLYYLLVTVVQSLVVVAVGEFRKSLVVKELRAGFCLKKLCAEYECGKFMRF